MTKTEPGADGELIPSPVVQSAVRESVLPEFPDMTEMITKDAVDQYR